MRHFIKEIIHVCMYVVVLVISKRVLVFRVPIFTGVGETLYLCV